jgi:hypothetical protein
VKLQRTPARRATSSHDGDDACETFGDVVSIDHNITSSISDQGVRGEGHAVVIIDRATRWISRTPVRSKNALETELALRRFCGKEPHKVIVRLYSDRSPEIQSAAKLLRLAHDMSMPYRPSNNGVAERAVRTVLEGMRCALTHAGAPYCLWSPACVHFSFAHNACGPGPGRSADAPHYRRFGQHFSGPIIPFGALVTFKPEGRLADAMDKWAPRGRKGIFVGYETKYRVSGTKMFLCCHGMTTLQDLR